MVDARISGMESGLPALARVATRAWRIGVYRCSRPAKRRATCSWTEDAALTPATLRRRASRSVRGGALRSGGTEVPVARLSDGELERAGRSAGRAGPQTLPGRGDDKGRKVRAGSHADDPEAGRHPGDQVGQGQPDPHRGDGDA